MILRSKQQLLYWTVLYVILDIANCYPNGASPKSCGHLTPGHGKAQLSPSPYSVEISTNTYKPGAIIPVSIKGPPYAGFILQAQIVGTRTIVGKWADPPLNTNIMSCSRSKDTMTHSSTMAKHNAIYRWIAPDYDVHLVEFIATVAPSKETWWRNVKSSTMTFDPRPVTPALPTFPPSIVPYTQDFDLAFPFQTKSPDVIRDYEYESYNEIEKRPSTVEVLIPSKLPIIKVPDAQNAPNSEEEEEVHESHDSHEPAKDSTPTDLSYLPPFPTRPPVNPDDYVSLLSQVIIPESPTKQPELQISVEETSEEAKSKERNDEYKTNDPVPQSPTSRPANSYESEGVTDTVIINATPDHKVDDTKATRDEGAEFPSRINPNTHRYPHKRRPFRHPRPPPKPWLGPGPDGQAFFHPWQRFSGWHGPRFLRWQNSPDHGYQSWRFMPTGRAAVDVPGVYEYHYYYKR